MGQNSVKVVLGAAMLLIASACAASPDADPVAELGSATTQILADDLGGAARSSDQQPVVDDRTNVDDQTDGTGWDTPSAILVAMAVPVEVAVPAGVTIESVSTSIVRDESRREVLSVDITVSAELEPLELLCLLQDQPPTPAAPPTDLNRIDCEPPEAGEDIDPPTLVHGAPEAPLPTFDSFFDWDAPVTRVQPQADGPDSVATTTTLALTTMQARRQGQDEGDNLNPSDIAGPARGLLAAIPESSASASRLTWRPDRPRSISAEISLSSPPEAGDEVVTWMRRRAAPGTFESDGATASATLAGEPPVAMIWRAGSFRNGGGVSFDYPLDEAGRPMANPTLAAEPIWTELIGWGAEWTYDADGVEDVNWSTAGFDDSDWSTGSAPFVRDEDGATNFQTPAPGTTGWLRTRFDLGDPATIERIDLEALVDDGFVVYLNGIEVHRWNLPTGPLPADAMTIERISGDDESIVRRKTDLVTDALVAGENVLAVAIHQGAPDSSDLRFDLRLAATQRLDL